MSLSSSSRRAGWWLDAVVLAIALVVVLPDRLFVAQQSLDHDFNLIDDSWKLELPARLARGEWAGRDFVFTYGPLYQLLHGVGPFFAPDNVAVQLRLARVLEAPLGVASLWIALVAVGAPAAWRRGLFLVWTLLFVATDRNLAGADLKPMAAVMAMALGGRVLITGPRVGIAAAWLLGPGLATLYSFDMGLMLLAALLTTLVVSFAVARFRPWPTRSAPLAAFGWLLGGVILFIGVFRLLPGFEDYIPASLTIAASYTEKMAIPLGPILPYPLLAAALIDLALCAIVLAKIPKDRNERSLAASGFALLATALFALGWLRYGVTRSDMHHVLRAVLPSVFVAGVLFPAWCVQARLAPGFAWSAASLPLVVASVCYLLVLDGWRGRLAAWSDGSLTAPTALRANPGMTAAIEGVARRPEPNVYQWGNATILQMAGGKRNPAWTVQTVVATAEELERGTVRGLEDVSDLSVFLAPPLLEVDGIPEEFRTPRIYEYLLRDFELDGPPEDSLLFLRPAPEGARVWKSTPLLRIGRDDFNGDAMRIGLPPNAIRASDILRLTLSVARTPVAGVFKPGRFQLAVYLETGEVQVWPLSVNADNLPHDYFVSFSSVRDRAFASHWHPRRCWRAVERVQRLELLWLPLDFLSRRPDWVRVDHLDLLERQGVETIELTRAEAREPAQLERIFGDFAGGGKGPGKGL